MNNMVIDSNTANKIVEAALEKTIDIVNPKIFTQIENKDIKYFAVELLEEKEYRQKKRVLYLKNKDYIILLASGLRDNTLKVSDIKTNVKNDKITYEIIYKKSHNHRRK